VGDFAKARELVDEAEAALVDLGAVATAFVICGTVRADIELLAGELEAAEATLREQCEHFDREGDRAHLAVRAAKLAEALYRQGQLDEAESWLVAARSFAASDDQSAQLIIGAVGAKVLAVRGQAADARKLAEHTVRLADRTDGLNLIAFTRLALAEVLSTAGLVAEARGVIAVAIDLFDRKGNSMGAAQARDLLRAEVPA
jgi:ATP/maltotriose-dependent transcriptional regulator MalT